MEFTARLPPKNGLQHSQNPRNATLLPLLLLHVVCGTALACGIWTLPRHLGFNLVEHPVETLRLALVLALPTVLFGYSYILVKPWNSGVLRSLGHGLISLPIGVCIATFGAIVFGAPLAFEYGSKTLYWALLMSVLTVVPAATVLGASWSDWQRLFAFTKPSGGIEYSVCIPAHGAAIGAWMGAWPMPLDWERPWQEWPVCVTYGMIGGYLLGLLLSLFLTFLSSARNRQKQE